MSPGARAVVAALRAYRRYVSPLSPRHCRYEPTCSAYTLEATRRHGAVKGLFMGARRISRCHPWAQGGVDPVPAPRGG
jgi:uncharacterized protein